jgi:hypothetical protein
LHEGHILREAKKKLASKERQRQTEEQQRPNINRISQIIVKKSFSERLKEDGERRELRKQSQERLRQATTAQEKRPSTGRAPVNRDLGEKTIGEYLYEKGKASRALSTKEAPKITADPKSAALYAESKRVAFEYVFQLLDSDQDGMISSTRISIGRLGPALLRLLAPLLAEMEEVAVELNAEEFSTAFDRLFAVIVS